MQTVLHVLIGGHERLLSTTGGSCVRILLPVVQILHQTEVIRRDEQGSVSGWGGGALQ
jgi:hypothetical protein